MTNQEIYEVMIKIDTGYIATEEIIQMLESITDIQWNGIPDLPKCMDTLKSLKIFKLTNSDIRDINAISKLTTLTHLDLSFTEINDVRALSKMQSLLELNISGTNVNDISPLSNLQSLTVLHLSVTKVKDISPLSVLTSMTTLFLNHTYINDISSLSMLKSLKYLLLRNTRVSDVSALSGLTELRMLFLGGTLVSDLSPLSNLTKLMALDLSDMKVLNWGSLSSLTSLTNVNLQNSTIKSMPESILDLGIDFITKENAYSWGSSPGIYIHGLTITDQPIELFSEKRELIRAYYKEGYSVPINECKVIFLGDAESGKTHSIKRLLNNGEYLVGFDGESTSGIEINVSPRRLANTDIIINYWDFGGQEIQHAMHRMFITDYAAYVVFLNARQDEQMDERARYWLENIRIFAPNAPVLVVINKIDQNEDPRFNEKGFLELYGNQVKKIIRLSAKNDKKQVFLDKLQYNINNIIMELPTVHRKIPKSWKNLMESVRQTSNHYLTTEQFIEKCKLNNIKSIKEIHDELVDLFQVIGVSFCYHKDRSIADYLLINPKWMLNALYAIVVNGRMIAQNGVITQDNLYDLLEKNTVNGKAVKRVIPHLRYTGFEINYILGVVRMFGLSYRLNRGEEFFPMLCDGNEKISVNEAVPEDALHFIFRYPFLPTNIIHQLIVEMQNDLDYHYVWYTGAIFRNAQQKQAAYIHSIGNDLHIYVYGEDTYYNLNEYLTPISNIVRNLNKSMGITAMELLTYQNGNREATIPLKRVMGNLQHGIDREYNESLDEIISYNTLVRRYFNSPLNVDEVLKSIIYALQVMQNGNFFYRTYENSIGLEDNRNRFVSAFIATQLEGKGYVCFDQQNYGIGASELTPGKCDFFVNDKSGRAILIYEGFNLTTFRRDYINKHIKKVLDNYNPMALRYCVLVTYLESDFDKFIPFFKKYKDYISKYAPEPYCCIGDPKDIRLGFEGKYLRCMKMGYKFKDYVLIVYHIIVRMAP